jgi:hypothetical protein
LSNAVGESMQNQIPQSVLVPYNIDQINDQFENLFSYQNNNHNNNHNNNNIRTNSLKLSKLISTKKISKAAQFNLLLHYQRIIRINTITLRSLDDILNDIHINDNEQPQLSQYYLSTPEKRRENFFIKLDQILSLENDDEENENAKNKSGKGKSGKKAVNSSNSAVNSLAKMFKSITSGVGNKKGGTKKAVAKKDLKKGNKENEKVEKVEKKIVENNQDENIGDAINVKSKDE